AGIGMDVGIGVPVGVGGGILGSRPVEVGVGDASKLTPPLQAARTTLRPATQPPRKRAFMLKAPLCEDTSIIPGRNSQRN
ncbi:MAG: hypothetical protein ACE5IZ_11600, partial [Dehalococcoidia bacterium]